MKTRAKADPFFFFLRLSLWSISIQLFLCGTILVCNVRCNVSLGLRRDTPGWHSLCAGFKKRSLCQHDNRKGLYVTSFPCTVVFLMYLWFTDERKILFPTYDVYVIESRYWSRVDRQEFVWDLSLQFIFDSAIYLWLCICLSKTRMRSSRREFIMPSEFMIIVLIIVHDSLVNVAKRPPESWAEWITEIKMTIDRENIYIYIYIYIYNILMIYICIQQESSSSRFQNIYINHQNIILKNVLFQNINVSRQVPLWRYLVSWYLDKGGWYF